MELKQIEQILQKYFEGESTDAEEQLLVNYFHSGAIHPELLKYKPFFSGITEISTQRDSKFEEQVMDYILEKEHHEKKHYRWLWQAVSGIAAALVITILVVNFNNTQGQWKDTYSDPNKAYAEASLTIKFIAGQYQKGMQTLEPVKAIETATKPLKNGLSKIKKGFEEINKVEQVDEKLKKQ